MTGYLEAVSTMHTRGVVIDEKDYIFTLMVVLGESPQNAFAFAYDMSEFKKVIGTEDEDAYLSTKTKDAENMLAQRQIIQLKDWLEEAYRGLRNPSAERGSAEGFSMLSWGYALFRHSHSMNRKCGHFHVVSYFIRKTNVAIHGDTQRHKSETKLL